MQQRDLRPRVLESGKLPHDLLARLLDELPPLPPEVSLGGAVGEDACGIDVPAGTLVVAADPITLTTEDLARLSVLVNANDVAVCGARPRWFLAVLLVPPGTEEPLVRELFRSLQSSATEIGAALVGGHTEVTPAVNQPVVIGQMLGLVEKGGLVTTGGVAPGDVVLQVGRAPIEGAAVLAREAGEQLGEVDPGVLSDAAAALDRPGISLVEQALLAAELGATALHDPTEGGLVVGLHELASAGGIRIRIDRDAVLWFEPGLEVCRVLGCDPWSTLASGTLLAAFPAERADAALAALVGGGFEAAVIGVAQRGSGVCDTDGGLLPWPERDELARLLAQG
jgi:hydrogenase expression/formation protein HypE